MYEVQTNLFWSICDFLQECFQELTEIVAPADEGIIDRADSYLMTDFVEDGS